MVWTPEQTGIFLDHAAGHPLYPLFHLMAFRGLCRGEACGLAWPDLDLAPHHRRQEQARDEWGQAWQASGRVFTREDGSALHPDHVTDAFARLAYGAGLPPIRLHDLRHGAATLMLAGGADMKLIQAMLRHSSLAITADTYTSVLPEVAREAAEAAAALVPRKIPAQEARPPVLPVSSQDQEE